MGELTQRLTIEQIVNAYLEAERKIRNGFALVAEAEDLLEATFLESIYVRDRHGGVYHSWDDPERVLQALRQDVWRNMIVRLDLRRMMSVKRWDELHRQLESETPPEITHETVAGMLRNFSSKLDVMLKEAVEEVYNFLRPRHNNYKTNSRFEVGRKVILNSRVESGWSFGYQVNYYYRQELTALENVMTALDGKGSINKSHTSCLEDEIKGSGKEGVGETEYFRFKCFKKGTLHLEFKRLDLLQRLNEIAGGKRLREAAE